MDVPYIIDIILEDYYGGDYTIGDWTKDTNINEKIVYHISTDDDISILINEKGNKFFRSEPVLMKTKLLSTNIPIPEPIETGVIDGYDYYISSQLNTINSNKIFHQLTLEQKQTLLFYAGVILGHIHSIDSFNYHGKIIAVDPGKLVLESDYSWNEYLYNEGLSWVNNIPNELKEYKQSITDILLQVSKKVSDVKPILCHNNYKLDNIGVHKNEGINSVFDFEHAIAGDRYYELAKTELVLIDLVTTGQLERTLLRRKLYDGYTQSQKIDKQYRLVRSMYRLISLTDIVSNGLENAPSPQSVINKNLFYHEKFSNEMKEIDSLH